MLKNLGKSKKGYNLAFQLEICFSIKFVKNNYRYVYSQYRKTEGVTPYNG